MAKKTKKAPGSRKKAGGGTGARGTTLRTASITELSREMQRRARDLDKLEQRRAAKMAEVNELDSEIDELRRALGHAPSSRAGRPASGRPARGRRGGTGRRPKNEQKLPDVLARVLKGKTMGVTEAAEAAKAAGYQSSSANFRNIVNQALITDGRFKRVGRGQYTAD